MIPASQSFINKMKSSQIELYVKLELFDENYNFIEEITQKVTSDIGMLTVDSSRPIRRSFDLRLDNSENEFHFGENEKIWINKRIKLYIGLKLSDGTVEYVPQGVFVLAEPQQQHLIDGKFTKISAYDKAYFMTDKRGKFVNEQIIETGTKITDAIRIIAQGAGETQFNFDFVDDTVPYELQYDGTSNRWEAIQELATLAKCSVYFDVNGFLTLRKIDLNRFETEPATWEYIYGSPQENLYAGTVRTYTEDTFANHIRVLGGSSQSVTVIYDLVVDETNPIWVDNPYSIQKNGSVVYFHNNNNFDSLITTTEQAKWRAKYELMNRLGFTEGIEMTIQPNYLQDVDDVVFLMDEENGIIGSKYIIRSLSIPLSPQLMTMGLLRYNRVIENWDFI